METKFKTRNSRYNHLILLYVILAAYAVFYVYDTSSASTIVINYIILGVILLAVAILAYFVLRKLRFFDRVGISEQGITLHVPFKDREFYSWDSVISVEKTVKSNRVRSMEYIVMTTDGKEILIEYHDEILSSIEKYYSATKSE